VRFFSGLILVLSIALVGCHRNAPRTTTPLPTPKIDYFQEGESSFQAQRWADAVRAYEQYIRSNPNAPDHDYVQFRLAVAYMVDGSGIQDVDRSMRILERVATDYPDSPWRAPAQSILKMRSRVEHLESQIAERDDRIKVIAAELETARARDTELHAQLEHLQQSATLEKKDRDLRIRQLNTSLEEMKERIQVLTGELDALKKIDIQRRPSRPPPE
jgi:outer membrane protein assembly factor BamD (BamD/ComL family)